MARTTWIFLLLILLLLCVAQIATGEGNPLVTIKEWDVPTPHSRPHDPAVAPDGSLWYTGQMANKLGRLDPQTGQFREYPLKTPESGPHGLVADRDGNIWFTAVFKGYVGKLNPATGEITEYHMPDARATDPHTPVFDQQGILWFTLEESNFPGGDGSEPYGSTVTADVIVWYSESGVKPNTLVRFDPKTKSFASTPVPSGGGVIRNMAATKDGRVYLACSGVNKVGIAQ